LQGYQARLRLADDQSAIAASGESYPHLELLRIDVSNALVRQDYKPTQVSVIKGELEPALSVGEFEYLASPLRYGDRVTHWQLKVQDAKFAILPEKGERAALVLTDASEGYLEFSAKVADLKPMMLRGAHAHAKAGFWVRDAAVSLASEDPRSLSARLRVQAVQIQEQRARAMKNLETEYAKQKALEDDKTALQGQLRVSQEALQKMQADLKAAQETLDDLSSRLSVAKAENIELNRKLGEFKQEAESSTQAKEALQARLNSLVELKKAIRELRRKLSKARPEIANRIRQDRIIIGNGGYMIKDGKPTYPARVKIEVVPLSQTP
jgi:hypothetical protein